MEEFGKIKERLYYLQQSVWFSNTSKKKSVVVFLDIDGVMLPTDNYKPSEEEIKKNQEKEKEKKIRIDYPNRDQEDGIVLYKYGCVFNEIAIENLNDLINRIEKTGIDARIIISSAWRYGRTITDLRGLFQYYPEISSRIVGKTHDEIIVENLNVKIKLNRGEQIYVWLMENSTSNNFCLKNYIILDDNDEGILELHGSNFVQCKKGLFTDKELKEAVEILNNGTKDSEDLFNYYKVSLLANNYCQNGSGFNDPKWRETSIPLTRETQKHFRKSNSSNENFIPVKRSTNEKTLFLSKLKIESLPEKQSKAYPTVTWVVPKKSKRKTQLPSKKRDVQSCDYD